MFRLDQKNAVITGGGSGIGRAISELFAKQGAHVHILELNAENANITVDADQVRGITSHSTYLQCSNQKEIVAFLKKSVLLTS